MPTSSSAPCFFNNCPRHLGLIFEIVLTNTRYLTNICELYVASKRVHQQIRRLARWCLRVEISTPDTLWPPRTNAATRELSVNGAFVATPPRIERIVWEAGANLQELHCIPETVTTLAFGDFFNGRLQGVAWPPRLRRLIFGCHFNQSLVGVVWPNGLRWLTFGSRFNRPIAGVSLPATLRRVSFGLRFNESLDGIVWPASITTILSICPSIGSYGPLSSRCSRLGTALTTPWTV